MSWNQQIKLQNNIVVVWRLHYINTLKQELNDTKAYEQTCYILLAN